VNQAENQQSGGDTAQNPQSALVKGVEFLKQGQNELAAEKLYQATRIDPENPDILKWYALALARSGRKDQAIEIYRIVLLRNPNDEEAEESLENLVSERIQHYNKTICPECGVEAAIVGRSAGMILLSVILIVVGIFTMVIGIFTLGILIGIVMFPAGLVIFGIGLVMLALPGKPTLQCPVCHRKLS